MTRTASRKPDFVLHKPPYHKAQILIAGENFGCGSSREHAPWALLDFGFRCVIAPSFADIFYNNCFKNGILPIRLPQSEIDKLLDDADRAAPNATVTDRSGEPGDQGARRRRRSISTSIPFLKRCLIEGLDDIGLTLEKAEHIEDFETPRAPAAPGPESAHAAGQRRESAVPTGGVPRRATAGRCPPYSNAIGFELCSTSVLPSRVMMTLA